MSVAEFGRRSGDENVAGERQLESAGETMPVNLGDGRLRKAFEGIDRLWFEVRARCPFTRRDRPEVVAGAE